jgi:Bacterial Ig-like domain
MRNSRLVLPLSLAVSALACSSTTGPTGGADVPALLAVVPAEGATAIDPTAPIVLTFNHPMGTGMEQFMDLHVGDINGPTVPMTATWSSDRTVLTIRPNQQLAHATTYVIHLGGDLMDGDGHALDYASCQKLGGQRLQASQMGQGSQHGSMGSGMGNGWRNADGSYGMVFTFTTS